MVTTAKSSTTATALTAQDTACAESLTERAGTVPARTDGPESTVVFNSVLKMSRVSTEAPARECKSRCKNIDKQYAFTWKVELFAMF